MSSRARAVSVRRSSIWVTRRVISALRAAASSLAPWARASARARSISARAWMPASSAVWVALRCSVVCLRMVSMAAACSARRRSRVSVWLLRAASSSPRSSLATPSARAWLSRATLIAVSASARAASRAAASSERRVLVWAACSARRASRVSVCVRAVSWAAAAAAARSARSWVLLASNASARSRGVGCLFGFGAFGRRVTGGCLCCGAGVVGFGGGLFGLCYLAGGFSAGCCEFFGYRFGVG